MGITFVLRRQGEETWREAAARMAKKHGMEHEVLEWFDSEKAAHPDADEAQIAFDACYEWDVLPVDFGDGRGEQ